MLARRRVRCVLALTSGHLSLGPISGSKTCLHLVEIGDEAFRNGLWTLYPKLQRVQGRQRWAFGRRGVGSNGDCVELHHRVMFHRKFASMSSSKNLSWLGVYVLAAAEKISYASIDVRKQDAVCLLLLVVTVLLDGSNFSGVEEIASLKSKRGIVTGDNVSHLDLLQQH